MAIVTFIKATHQHQQYSFIHTCRVWQNYTRDLLISDNDLLLYFSFSINLTLLVLLHMNFQASNLRFICKHGWRTIDLKTENSQENKTIDLKLENSYANGSRGLVAQLVWAARWGVWGPGSNPNEGKKTNLTSNIFHSKKMRTGQEG